MAKKLTLMEVDLRTKTRRNAKHSAVIFIDFAGSLSEVDDTNS